MKTWHLTAIALLPILAACASQPSGADYILDRTLEVEGRQGVATDGHHYYVSGSTALYRYGMDGRLEASDTHPFDALTLECNHIGDIDIWNGEIYAGCEWFMDGEGHNIQIAVYDASTLQYKYSIPWEPASGQVECCGLAVDTVNNEVWMADWVDGSRLYCYDIATKRFSRSLELRLDGQDGNFPTLQQGIAFLNGKILISCDDGDADKGEADHLYLADPETGKTTLFRTMDDFRLTGEIEGLTVNPLNGELSVLSNRGARIILGMPRGYYPGYDREIHEIYIYRRAKS